MIRFVSILCCLSIWLAACDTVKFPQKTPSEPSTPPKTTTPKEKPNADEVVVYNPTTGKYEKQKRAEDSNTNPSTTKPSKVEKPSGNPAPTTMPNKEDENTTVLYPENDNPNTHEIYKVAFLLPFYTDKFNATDPKLYDKANWAVQFYAGAKLALDSLNKEGVKLKVSVFDTKANEAEVGILLARRDTREADVIIGGETRNNIRLIADFAKNNDKIMVSPYNPGTDIVSDNPNFLQLAPSLKTHCEALVKHARKKLRSDQLILITNNKPNELELLPYFQNANASIEGSSVTKLREIAINEATFIKTDFKPYFKAGQTTAFIIPSWANETFIYSLLSKIDADRGKNSVVVYGMPQWLNFEMNTIALFRPLKVHLPLGSYPDRQTPYAKSFMQNYYYNFSGAPQNEAFLGFDITYYIGKMLFTYGRKFQEHLESSTMQGLQNRLSFQKEVPYNQTGDTFNRINKYENKAVNILKYENYWKIEQEN